jgi:hypothetical protein
MATRCVIVHGNGSVTLADGKLSGLTGQTSSPYNLDAAFQNGATIKSGPHPIGPHGTAVLIIITEGER